MGTGLGERSVGRSAHIPKWHCQHPVPPNPSTPSARTERDRARQVRPRIQLAEEPTCERDDEHWVRMSAQNAQHRGPPSFSLSWTRVPVRPAGKQQRTRSVQRGSLWSEVQGGWRLGTCLPELPVSQRWSLRHWSQRTPSLASGALCVPEGALLTPATVFAAQESGGSPGAAGGLWGNVEPWPYPQSWRLGGSGVCMANKHEMPLEPLAELAHRTAHSPMLSGSPVRLKGPPC